MKKIKVVVGSLAASLSFLPMLAFAQSTNLTLTNLDTLLLGLQNLMNRVVPILIGLAVIFFLFGLLKFVMNANDPEKRKEGRGFMIWAIIAIVIMVSVWGLVIFIQGAFGINSGNSGLPPTYPKI